MAEADDDWSLMRAISRREAAGVASLYDRYSTVVFTLCLRMLGQRESAEELLQEVFFELWERPDRYDPDRGSVLAYVLGIARSRAIDRLRAARSQKRAPVKPLQSLDVADQAASSHASSAAGPLEAVAMAEQRDLVRQALSQLPQPQREALELAYFGALSQAEIADYLHTPLGTIKSRIRQALDRLSKLLADADTVPISGKLENLQRNPEDRI